MVGYYIHVLNFIFKKIILKIHVIVLFMILAESRNRGHYNNVILHNKLKTWLKFINMFMAFPSVALLKSSKNQPRQGQEDLNEILVRQLSHC